MLLGVARLQRRQNFGPSAAERLSVGGTARCQQKHGRRDGADAATSRGQWRGRDAVQSAPAGRDRAIPSAARIARCSCAPATTRPSTTHPDTAYGPRRPTDCPAGQLPPQVTNGGVDPTQFGVHRLEPGQNVRNGIAGGVTSSVSNTVAIGQWSDRCAWPPGSTVVKRTCSRVSVTM
jgi:hypothetical protein